MSHSTCWLCMDPVRSAVLGLLDPIQWTNWRTENIYLKIKINTININVVFYIIKQDIHIYVPYSRPNGWTEWAEIFCGQSWVAGGCYRLKKLEFFSFKTFFFRKSFFQNFLFSNFFSSTGNAGPFS